MHLGVLAETLRMWAGYSQAEGKLRIPDDQVLVINATIDEAGKLALNLASLNERVLNFVAHTVRAHASTALRSVWGEPDESSAGSEGKGKNVWQAIRSRAASLVSDAVGTPAGLERAGGGVVPLPLYDSIPWDVQRFA